MPKFLNDIDLSGNDIINVATITSGNHTITTAAGQLIFSGATSGTVTASTANVPLSLTTANNGSGASGSITLNTGTATTTVGSVNIQAAGVKKIEANATGLGFFAATPVGKAAATADIKDAFVAYGLLTDSGATPLNLDGGAFTAGAGTFSGVVSVTDTATTTGVGSVMLTKTITNPVSFASGIYSRFQSSQTTAAFGGENYALVGEMWIAGTQNWNGGGAQGASGAVGVMGRVEHRSGTITITNAEAFISQCEVASNGTITNSIGYRVLNPVKTGTGIVTNAYGLYVNTLSAGATLNYGVYVDTNTSYFGGGLTLTNDASAANSIVVGTTNGLKIGTATSQKLGFFNATPVIQAIATSDIKDTFCALGFMVNSGASPLNLDGGTLTAGAVSVTTGAFSDTTTITKDAIVVTSTDGLVVQNTTDSTVGVTVQMSPRIRLHGEAWKSAVTAANNTSDWIIENLPATGAAAITSSLRIGHSNNGAAYAYSVVADSNSNFVLGTAALATSATDGFLHITSCAGTPTGVPTAFTGRVPLVFDTTNNKLYGYDASWIDLTPSGGGSPAGSTTELQYRNGGAFGATTGITYNATEQGLDIVTAAAGTALSITGATSQSADLITMKSAATPGTFNFIKVTDSAGTTTYFSVSNLGVVEVGGATITGTNASGLTLNSGSPASSNAYAAVYRASNATLNGVGGGVSLIAGNSQSTDGTARTGGTITITGGTGSGTTGGAGGAISITAGTGGASGVGGALTLQSGSGTSATSGAVTLQSFTMAGGGNSGAVDVKSGGGTTASGTLTLASGNLSGAGTSGNVVISTGSGSSSGSVNISTAAGTTAGGISLTLGAGGTNSITLTSANVSTSTIVLAQGGTSSGGIRVGTASTDKIAFFGASVSAATQATTTEDIKDAFVRYGLLQGTSATPLNLDGGVLTCSNVSASSGTITTDTPGISISQTWNASGTTFRGININLATGSDTNSAANSSYFDCQLNAVSRFNISKTGKVTASAAILHGVVALTDAATVTVDAAAGNQFNLLFTAGIGTTRAMGAPSSPVDGQKITFRFKQDATGSRVVTWNAVYRFSGAGTAPTLTATANEVDYLGFIYNSADSKWDCVATSLDFRNA